MGNSDEKSLSEGSMKLSMENSTEVSNGQQITTTTRVFTFSSDDKVCPATVECTTEEAMSMYPPPSGFLYSLAAALLLGQCGSLLLTGTGIFSSALATWHNWSFPVTQSLPNYVLLGFVYSCVMIYQGRFWSVWKEGRWWRYAILAISDVEANYLVVKAYEYTNLTSIALLDCVTIPTVVMLSVIFLHIRYLWPHYLGVFLCVCGIISIALNDYFYVDNGEASNMLLGDIFCLAGAVLYGVNNVAQEYLVKKFDLVEYLGFLGIFGTIVCGTQAGILEGPDWADYDWNISVILYFMGFNLCMFIFYTVAPLLMAHPRGGATLLNLSLLTSDVFSVLASYYIFDFDIYWLYAIAFVLVVSGITVYSLKPWGYANRKSEETSEVV
eukprot:Nk52_evm113s151 gene=Nk52_evmTU113s151